MDKKELLIRPLLPSGKRSVKLADSVKLTYTVKYKMVVDSVTSRRGPTVMNIVTVTTYMTSQKKIAIKLFDTHAHHITLRTFWTDRFTIHIAKLKNGVMNYRGEGGGGGRELIQADDDGIIT